MKNIITLSEKSAKEAALLGMNEAVFKLELARYIRAHEAAGKQFDTECQEVRYDDGVYLLMRKMNGSWLVTELWSENTAAACEYKPHFIITTVREGFRTLMAKVLACWECLSTPRYALKGRVK